MHYYQEKLFTLVVVLLLTRLHFVLTKNINFILQSAGNDNTAQLSLGTGDSASIPVSTKTN